jgi:hypothetical protein
MGPSGSGPDAHYAGVYSTWRRGSDDRFIAIYHGENHDGMGKMEGNDINGAVWSVCLAMIDPVSGRIERRGDILRADKPKRPIAGQPHEVAALRIQGVGEPCMTPDRDGNYLLCYYTEASNRLDRRVCICVARSPIEEGGAPGTWKKFHQGRWEEPGLGGHETPVLTAEGGDVGQTYVTFVKAWDRYVIVFCHQGFEDFQAGQAKQSGIYVATSQDGVRWTTPRRIMAELTVFKTGKPCVQHPTLLVNSATKDRLSGRLYYAFTPRWPTPHHLAASPIMLRLGGEREPGDQTPSQAVSSGGGHTNGMRDRVDTSGTNGARLSSTGLYQRFQIRFDTPDAANRFVFSNQNGRAFLQDSELRIVSPDPWQFRGGGHATLRKYFSTYRSVRILGRIVKPSSHEFRFCVGQLDGILLWQGAENEHHFRVANGPKAVKTDGVVIPGEKIEILVEQTRQGTASVRVNGVALYEARVHLEGPLTVYTAGNEIAVQEIEIEGIPDPRREVREVPLEYMW